MFNEKKTKIISTIGPSSCSEKIIERLIEAGTNIFRFNMKHATIEWHEEYIKKVNKIAKKMKKKVGVLIDLQGPEIRLNTKNEKDITIKKGDKINFGLSFNGDTDILISDKCFFSALKTDDIFLIDDGLLKFKVTKSDSNSLAAEAENSGKIKNRKSINAPNKTMNLPSLTADDLKKLDLAARAEVDFIALSFTRNEKDINNLKKQLEKRKISPAIIAKIENREAINNIDVIIKNTDAIMIARGDLGIEIPIEEIAFIQKMIAKKCRLAQRPVIVATHMLQSMVNNQRPTRAEATDVANAVFDGVDVVMLSEETASGKYPVNAVKAMAKILKFNENSDTTKRKIKPSNLKQLIINAAASLLNCDFHYEIDAVVVFSETGYTARILSSFHPKVPIIAVTDTKKALISLILSYGITPFYMEAQTSTHKTSSQVINLLKKKGVIKIGQTLLFVHGEHTKTIGPISSIALVNIK